ncbi:MAG: hypothetical protein R2912_05225 [Eubacteriales bacterium]
MPKSKKPKKWMKLDNAALIYPATMNRNWTALSVSRQRSPTSLTKTFWRLRRSASLRRLPWFAYKLKARLILVLFRAQRRSAES